MAGPGVFASAGNGRFRDVERVLGDALKNFAAELRLTDAADFGAFIRLQHMPNLQCIVRSSAELHFKPGTLDLAGMGELELSWSSPPVVTLPMLFHNCSILVYFRLRLAALSAAVEVESIKAPTHVADELLGPMLSKAIENARSSRASRRSI